MWTTENRPRYNRDSLRYPSDLSDEEWTLVEPLIPPPSVAGVGARWWCARWSTARCMY
jgi:hypothetical protein